MLTVVDTASGATLAAKTLPFSVFYALSAGSNVVLFAQNSTATSLLSLDLTDVAYATLLASPTLFSLDAIDNSGRIFYGTRSSQAAFTSWVLGAC